MRWNFTDANVRTVEDKNFPPPPSLPPPPTIQTSAKFRDFAELYFLLFSTHHFHPLLTVIRRSFQPRWRIFANWFQSKVEKTVEEYVEPRIILHKVKSCCPDLMSPLSTIFLYVSSFFLYFLWIKLNSVIHLRVRISEKSLSQRFDIAMTASRYKKKLKSDLFFTIWMD